ncbi:amino acid ABC transporter substrate-binding protein [Basilea psittacipulmonis]|uniref:Amino acid ABC transporter substrate-binding protein n=1 Tax=Basilea psittacipulmonis DSM 24701 TaxID=1072685 RepID=A0A077DC90_9BURK|nr:amino acid ABC transporter substrate-binding protein [Basilea psittacipulmonis]AIL32229.1 amino acid ABC transporter substrate-binding protein [Basilea psittacipulmonis DSM 24701]
MKKFGLMALGAMFTVVSGLGATAQAGTLDNVKKRGEVVCGTTTGFAGFSGPNSKGEWTGLDIDLCKAIAAATLGDANKFKVVPLNSQQRFTALQSGEVDVLTRNTTVTQQRDTGLGIMSAGINFYDGQGFLIEKKFKEENDIHSAKDLSGAKVCMQNGTSDESNMSDWARANNVKYTPVVFDQFSDVVAAFANGRCDVFTTDASGLASIRVSRMADPSMYELLPEVISKGPLGPFVRQGDDEWYNVVKWTLQAMINAEELGLTSENVDTQLNSANPAIKRFLGVTPGLGKNLNLDEKWAYHIIKQVGNYGESFDRNVGKNSPLGLERGQNALYNKGGLMYGLPF